MTNLLQQFREFILKENLFTQQDKLLIAVSGGMDSAVLCALCYLSGFDFVMAHCNFQLRGDESDRDENFVKILANKYGKTILVKKFDTVKYAVDNKTSIQEAARELRYGWFYELTQYRLSESTERTTELIPSNDLPFPVQYILTAHQLDDSVETLLMNFFKGTGIAGLHGILPKQGKIVRPLLFSTKQDLLKFAKQHHLSWVEDSSNLSDKYTRNYFRHQIIPLVEKIYPGVVQNLSSNIVRFREAEILYQQSIDRHKKILLEIKGKENYIPVLKLKKSIPLPTIIYEIIKEYSFTSSQVVEVIHLLDSTSGKFIQSATHRIIKNRNWLIISPNYLKEGQFLLIDDLGTWEFAGGKIHFEISKAANYKLQKSMYVAQLDADIIKLPLILRKWKPGDYFYPLGMQKKKKLARFFIDQKLSQTEKEKIWILEMNKKIVWIAGLRIDDRFKITPSTRNILKIEMRVT